MRVKSIVLDGFKSYAHRQELADLDKHFNAITGFNGSGKSNVFDAICFVMGISNLKKVRADDTRDLIYRAGAAGVQSARVTIEFINDDAHSAPAGYPPNEYPVITIGRQTQIGGKQRYFFMNRLSDQAKIKHFFQNIHLNVDNPHFMVLQGTVHKLIGMKSSDILALVEEAVGTKVFDVRRRTAENLIRSKERKLEEMNRNLTHEIGPMLEAMKADQIEYDQFLKASEALEANRKYRVAFHFWSATQQSVQHKQEKEHLEEELAATRASLQALPGLIAAQNKLVVEHQGKLREPEGAYAKLHEDEAEAKKELQRAAVQLASSDKTMQDFKKQQKQFVADQAECAKQRAALKGLADERSAWEAEASACSTAIAAVQESLRLHRSGVRAGANGLSLEEERAEVEHKLIRVQGEMKRVQERVEELEATAEQLRKRVKADLQHSTSLQQQVEQSKKRHLAACAQHKPFEEAERRLQQVQAELNTMQRDLHAMQTSLHQSPDQTHSIQFHHDPIPSIPDIDTRILGRLGQLIAPKEARYSVALSVGGGPNLMKVVLTDDNVAQALVDHGRLRQRTSFLPLNQVQPARVDARRVDEAVRCAKEMGGFACLAKDLLNYEPVVAGAVNALFGTFLVCSDLEVATKIAFDPKIAMKAVTMDGEITDPFGSMTGGSVTDSVDVLSRIHEQVAKMAPLRALQQQIRDLEQERTQLAIRVGKGGGAKRDMEAAEDDLQRAQEKLRALTGVAGEQLERAEADIARYQAKGPELRNEELHLAERKAELDQHEAQDSKSIERNLEAKLKTTTQRAAQLKKLLDGGVVEFDKKEGDIEQREADLLARGLELERDMEAQTKTRLDLEACQRNIAMRIESILEERKLSDSRRLAAQRDLEDAENGVKALRDRQDGQERRVKELDLQLKAAVKALADDEKHVHDLGKKAPWLLQERASFGALDGPYPFEDAEGAKKTLKSIEEAEALSEKMSRKVNKKSTVLYESVKKEYEELMEKRATLDEDRQAILEVIDQVELRKWASLDRMVQTVSKIFSTLFSACLPGATARLVEERNDHGHISGLQVRVSFHGKEKESLTELSGGQRSLLALCLILAILRLKPAPIYILDEVDAALDPSHTQNIGRMLQQHFSNSQFLLVSLKDGMFNHANVLYEVRNTQGFSEITRKEARRQ